MRTPGDGAGSGRLAEIPWWARAIACALLAVFALQASVAARRDSVTIDEFVHLPLGLYNLYTCDFRDDPINPPLPRMIAALALLRRPPAFNPEPGTAHWSMGYHLMQRNVEDYQAIYVAARSMMILLACVVATLVFLWTTELYGWQSGLAALVLFAFSPTMLAHGHLVTLDMSGVLGFTVTAYATWRMLARATLWSAVVVGAALGAATLLKLSGFVLVAFVVLCVLVRALSEPVRGRGGRRATVVLWARLLVAAAVACVVTLNVGYGFEGTMAPLTDATLDARGQLAALRDAAPWLRLPLPLPLINGIDMVLNVGKQSDPSYFLAGELTSEGWWYYHLAAFAVKTPLPLAALGIFALVMWVARRSPGLREYCLFTPVLIIFASNSLFNSLQIGVRHVLPVYAFLMIGGAPWLVRALATWRRPGAARWPAALAALGLVWFVAGSAAVAPRYLQYFNEIGGGPAGGHRMLVDSNIDWGQDLIRLREYMDREQLDYVNLAYFGRVDPAVYGIRFVPLERGRVRGPVVISASFLMGRPYFWVLGGRMRWVPSRTYTWLQDFEPVARVGSMFVFDLEE